MDLNSLRIIILIGVILVIGISQSPKHLSSFWVRTQLLSEDAVVCDSVKPLAHSNCRVSLYRGPKGRLQWEKAQQKALSWPTTLHGVLLSSMSSFSKIRGKGLQGKWTSYKPWLASELLQVNLLCLWKFHFRIPYYKFSLFVSQFVTWPELLFVLPHTLIMAVSC